jgi:uncharacterized protein YbjT (DUF2867 family)
MFLITGASNPIGYVICELLSKDKSPFRAAIHNVKKITSINKFTDDISNIDYHNFKTLNHAFSAVQKLFLLTPPDQKMIEMTKNAVLAAKENGVSHIIKLSSFGANYQNESIIGGLHRESEKIIEQSGIRYTFLRPMNFMQNIVNQFGPMIKKYKEIILPCGAGKVSFIDSGDISRTVYAILTDEKHINKTYNITGKECLSFSEIAGILSDVLKRNISYRDVDEDTAIQVLKEMGYSDFNIKIALVNFRIIKENKRSMVINTVREITGEDPVTFRQYVKDNIGVFNAIT